MSKPSPFKNHWATVLPHPLAGKPLSEQVSDEVCDALAKEATPEGFALRTTVQCRDKTGKRIIRATFSRIVPLPFAFDAPPFYATLNKG